MLKELRIILYTFGSSNTLARVQDASWRLQHALIGYFTAPHFLLMYLAFCMVLEAFANDGDDGGGGDVWADNITTRFKILEGFYINTKQSQQFRVGVG